jgi:hypothetical protein
VPHTGPTKFLCLWSHWTLASWGCHSIFLMKKLKFFRVKWSQCEQMAESSTQLCLLPKVRCHPPLKLHHLPRLIPPLQKVEAYSGIS